MNKGLNVSSGISLMDVEFRQEHGRKVTVFVNPIGAWVKTNAFPLRAKGRGAANLMFAAPGFTRHRTITD
jgi:hypothetical protein